MRANGSAARRFYNAFYQWTLLVHAPHAHHRALNSYTRAIARDFDPVNDAEDNDGSNTYMRHFPTARAALGQAEDHSPDNSASFSWRKQRTSIETRHNPERSAPRQNAESESLPSIIHTEVQSPHDRPFTAMKPWEEVVRYKSFAGFSVEICIPENAVTFMERGRSLQSLLSLQDLHVDVGNSITNGSASGEPVAVRSILATGTVENIDALREKFEHIRSQMTRSSNKDDEKRSGTTRSTSVPLIRPVVDVPRIQFGANNFDGVREKNLRDPGSVNQTAKGTRINQAQDQFTRRGNDGSLESSKYRSYKSQEAHRHPIQRPRSLRNNSKEAPAPTEAQGEITPPGEARYRITLTHPSKADFADPEEPPFHWRREIFDHIRSIQKANGCSGKRNGNWLIVTGPKPGIDATLPALQAMLDNECDTQTVPRRQLEVVMPLSRIDQDGHPLQQDGTRIPGGNAAIAAKKRTDQIKTALRALTHPVVLVIATMRDISPFSQKKGVKPTIQLRGVTVSSLTSVAMDPTPIISFNLRLPSRTWDAIQSHNKISLSFLTATPDGAAVAHAFTQPHEDPAEPFRHLQRLGVEAKEQIDGARCLSKMRTEDRLGDTVFCTMAAKVLRENCVHVEDHVIVVARVTAVLGANLPMQRAERGKALGLAYANRNYRKGGEVIKPTSVPEERNVDAQAQANLLVEGDKGWTGTDFGYGESDQVDASDEAAEERRADLNALFDAAQNSQHGVEREATEQPPEEAAVDVEDPLRISAKRCLNRFDDQQTPESLEQMSEEQAADLEANGSQDHLPSDAEAGSKPATHAAADATSSSAAHTEPKSSVGFIKQFWRSYSTSARRLNSTAETSTSETSESNQLESQVTDSTLLATTARDFLNAPSPEDSYTPRRMRALMKARKESYQARRQLQYLRSTNQLTLEEAERLKNIVTQNEHWIAKKLAFNSAYDLRLMLDNGKVDVKRAQWLEASIEKGQAVLLEEMQQLRTLFESEKVEVKTFRQAMEKLEKDNLYLATEAMRLRQMVDDEEWVESRVEEKKAFDGFSGNV